MSDIFRPHGLQHTRLLCPSLSPRFAQSHVYWVSDAIQPSHPFLSPSPPALNLSQYQRIFQWVWCLHQMTKILELQLQHQFFQWIFIQDWFPLGLTFLISLQSKGLLRVFSSTTVKSINYLVLSLLYGPTLTSIHDYWKDHGFDYMDLCQQSDIFAFQYAV